MTRTVEAYQAAFEQERLHDYPCVDEIERRTGFALDRVRLEAAARVLACPLKNSPPNWQHGRVIYSVARQWLYGRVSGCWDFLDIGTAKGFSALCLQWAMMDHAGGAWTSGVTSVDVIDPEARVSRNTIAECDGLLTLRETLQAWPESSNIKFVHGTGLSLLEEGRGSFDFAFIDGKHSRAVVTAEGRALADVQSPGNIAIFDDVHIADVRQAVDGLSSLYAFEYVNVLPRRAYAIGVRRG